MKVTFFSDLLTDSAVKVLPLECEILPEIGDFIFIDEFMSASDKEMFQNYMKSIGKIVLGRVDARIWRNELHNPYISLSLQFDDETEE